MATQTYCTAEDVEFVLSEAGVTARVDDEETGQRSAAGDAFITKAIAKAAREINGKVRHQYKIADVAGNEWLNDVNAYLAAETLERRRGNPVPEPISEECQRYRDQLDRIAAGTDSIPEQPPSFDFRPAVSNVEVQLDRIDHPVRVNVNESTGPHPVSPTKRFILRRWFG